MPKRFQLFLTTTLACSMLLLALPGTASAALVHVSNNVPEIDAGSAASALTLIIGAAMLLKDKFRTK